MALSPSDLQEGLSANIEELIKAISLINLEDKNDLMKLAFILIDKFKYKIFHENWFDIGHSATYLDTKISSFNSRFFNQISYDFQNNSVKKTSSDVSKITQEYYFYKNLPSDLKRLFPYVFERVPSEKKENLLEMEFISQPNLAEIFLFKRIGPNGWIKIINSIDKVIELFYSKKKPVIKSNLSWLYSEKLKNRFELLKKFIYKNKNHFIFKVLKNDITINNKFKINSLHKAISYLSSELEIYEKNVGQYIGHGDLCFNNILVDNVSGSIKLIDPKSFYNEQLGINGLMDKAYDISKLNHSFRYLYDSVVNNMFVINFQKNNINLKIYAPKDYEMINNYFDEIIIRKNIDEKLLKNLTSNLFFINASTPH